MKSCPLSLRRVLHASCLQNTLVTIDLSKGRASWSGIAVAFANFEKLSSKYFSSRCDAEHGPVSSTDNISPGFYASGKLRMGAIIFIPTFGARRPHSLVHRSRRLSVCWANTAVQSSIFSFPESCLWPTRCIYSFGKSRPFLILLTIYYDFNSSFFRAKHFPRN